MTHAPEKRHPQTDVEEEQSRREKQLAETIRIANVLLEAANIIGSTLDTDLVLERFSELVAEITNLERNIIFLYDPLEHSHKIAAEYNGGIAIGTSFSGEEFGEEFFDIYRSGRATVIDIDDPNLSPATRRTMDSFNAKTGLFVPLVAGERILGSIGMDNPGRRHEFNQREIELASGLAKQAAVAIENSRLYKAQLNIADSLQRSMLPTRIPTIPGAEIGVVYSSATEEAKVGGDFYDIFDLEGKFALIIGDVSGKGIEAASYTSMVKYAMRAHLYLNPTPSYAVTQVNKFVRRQVNHAVFITAFCSIFDPATGVLNFVNAGHPYPCLLDKVVNKCTFLTTNDPAISIIADYEYHEKEVTIGTDNLFVAYTDGVLEARSDAELFGEERLEETLLAFVDEPAQKLADAIIDACLKFSKGRLTDDIALLVMKRV
ncbi:MAG: hypothetical protein A2074_05715 [Candidatus Aquicultor primus]|uniref:GAF domain-containing protein n=1 Tax=Candidatus Aquicultor primus TaxID=1797195 RepID=A0A1F2UGR0_9ACTN|nr:MAG: hypothetical protein A2074_05715 [Candidatus Aquicultor primus]